MATPIRPAYRCALLAVALAWAVVGLAATKEDNKQAGILEAGRVLLIEEHKPALAISEHFDKVIRSYEARHRNSKDRIYCARTPAEVIYYSALGASQGQNTTVIDSTWSDAYFLKGYALVELEQPAEARKLLARALELSPMNSAYLSESAHLDQMAKDWDTALAKFELATEAAEMTPENSRVYEKTRALRGQGFALIELGRLEEAKSMYHKALELDPNDEGSKGELRYIERMEANLATESEPFTENPDWILKARIAFVEKDSLKTRPAMSQRDFKLWFPWIGGDLYGAPTTNDFIEPVLDADYSFAVDLNKSRSHLIRSLDVAHFTDLDFAVEPADVRIARVATFAVRPDMSAAVGSAVWRDSSTPADHFLLVYFDRACHVTGTVQFKEAGFSRKYDLAVPSAGYYWLRSRKLDEAHHEMTVSGRPADLVLAIEPRED